MTHRPNLAGIKQFRTSKIARTPNRLKWDPHIQ
jgi:hypothetical protein